MKSNKIIEKEKAFDTVKTFRTIKEKISEEIADMNFEQIKEYLNKKSKKFKKEQDAIIAK